MKSEISCVIITKNEAHNIRRCLESVKWMDEVIVVDSGSEDETVAICKSMGCKVIEIEWMGYGKTKGFAVKQAKHDWVFSIDADEEMTPELRQRVEKILSSTDAVQGYYVRERTFYLGRLIRFSGWGSEYHLRLFNRNYGNYNEKELHESIRLKGEKARIEEHLLHYSYPSIEVHLRKINLYTTLGAQQLKAKGRSSSILSALIRGKLRFIKTYFLYGGFLDGREGLCLALISAYGVSFKYLKLWKMTR